MNVLEVSRRTIEKKELIRRSALESDCSVLVSEPTLFMENGKPIIIYGELDFPHEKLRTAVQQLKYSVGKRTNGLVSTSRIFGFRPRVTIRQDFCSSTSLAKENVHSHQLLCQTAVQMDRLYAKHASEVYTLHRETVCAAVLPEWRIPGTVFTSGIVNKNNPLKYHQDAGNFRDCLSAMIVLKKNVRGGYLSLPEYDLKLDLKDSSFLIFNGQEIIHGVTPIKREPSNSAYRHTIVYYALKGMCHCQPIQEEIKRIRLTKKAREEKRALQK